MVNKLISDSYVFDIEVYMSADHRSREKVINGLKYELQVFFKESCLGGQMPLNFLSLECSLLVN